MRRDNGAICILEYGQFPVSWLEDIGIWIPPNQLNLTTKRDWSYVPIASNKLSIGYYTTPKPGYSWSEFSLQCYIYNNQNILEILYNGYHYAVYDPTFTNYTDTFEFTQINNVLTIKNLTKGLTKTHTFTSTNRGFWLSPFSTSKIYYLKVEGICELYPAMFETTRQSIIWDELNKRVITASATQYVSDDPSIWGPIIKRI